MKIRVTAMILMIIMLANLIPAFAIDSSSSTTALRMQPLISKLNALNENNIQSGINKYSDVKKHWARNYIGRLTLLEVIGGGSKGSFNPDGDMSIAGFIKMVTLSLGYKIVQGTGKTPWYNPYISQAKKDRLIDNGDFTNYTKAITREQASKILYRAAMLFQADVKDQGHMGVMRCRMKDYALIGDKYKDFMVKSYILGYFTLGSTAAANPKGKFTRAQACTVVIRLLDAKERAGFTVKDNEYYIGTDGKKYYPIWSMDPVNAINVVEKNLGKSTGYVQKGVCGYLGADYIMYENEDEYISDPINGMDCTISIYTDNSPSHSNWLFDLHIYNREAVKSKHYAILRGIFMYFFEGNSINALKELDNILNKSSSKVDKEVKMNNRYLCIYGTNNVSISITYKGGLNSKQFLEKYPS